MNRPSSLSRYGRRLSISVGTVTRSMSSVLNDVYIIFSPVSIG